MLKKLRDRYVIIGLVILIAAGIMIYQLQYLQLWEGTVLASQSENKTTRTLTLKGYRGTIYDSSYIPLVYDQRSYDVVFYKDVSKRSETCRRDYTGAIINTLSIVEKNGGKLQPSFAIVKDENGEYAFSWGNITEEQAAAREKLWRSNLGVSAEKYPTAGDVVARLRTYYCIPEEASDELAMKILAVWQEVQMNAFRSYYPVTIAKDVDERTIAEIETHSNDLTGMSIEESSIRVYPRGTLASHILGYTGKMQSEETIEKYEALGYGSEDQIGLTGVEYSMEEYLTGNSVKRQGKRVVEVNSLNKVTRELEYTAPTAGDNVVLTIDTNLQKTLETALEENVQQVRQNQMTEYSLNPSKYQPTLDQRGSELKLAETASAVVMDVHTGNILAMASYPDYDPSLFVGGISQSDYKVLSEDKRYPLFNKAISSKTAPGSVFKMTTGLAGLMEGSITLNTTISDQGPYNAHVLVGSGPQCWVAPNFDAHSNQTITTGLKNSCNYFFYEVADRLGIDKLYQWADNLGLVGRTNIQLPGEAASTMACQNILFDKSQPIENQSTSYGVLVYGKIYDMVKETCESAGVAFDEEKADTIIRDWLAEAVDVVEMGGDIKSGLKELGVPSRNINTDLIIGINSYLSEIRWNPNMTLVAGIGQSVTAITPISLARYIATLVNGGTVYDANLVKEIVSHDGQVVDRIEPKVKQQLDIPSSYISAIKEGMREVVSDEDGTASNFFKDFEYKDMVGGKTGTAETFATNTTLENDAWFVAFAPFDDPEIAIVVSIPCGWKGGQASYTAREVIAYYVENMMNTKEADKLPETGAVTP